jgi:hypothetical protein
MNATAAEVAAGRDLDRSAVPETQAGVQPRADVAAPLPNVPLTSPAAAAPPPCTRPSSNRGRSHEPAPSVHIGILDIRIAAPQLRAEAPSRQPVSFRGSGIISRLYLRRV